MPLYLSVPGVQAEGTRMPVPPEVIGPVVPPGQRVIAVVNNGAWQSALDVSHPDMYRRVWRQMEEGLWRELQLYSLDEQRALALADGRRVTMAGQPIPDPGRAAGRR